MIQLVDLLIGPPTLLHGPVVQFGFPQSFRQLGAEEVESTGRAASRPRGSRSFLALLNGRGQSSRSNKLVTMCARYNFGMSPQDLAEVLQTLLSLGGDEGSIIE